MVKFLTKKSGFVAVIGKPNAGKSTLINSVLGFNVSIVTPKPQTTRNRIFGIYTRDNVQAVFVDTPGILEPRYRLQAFMKKEVESSFAEADIISLVIDANTYNPEEIKSVYDKYKNEFVEQKLFFVINKIDLVKKEIVLMIIEDISKRFKCDEIIPLSAKTGFNVDDFLNTTVKYLPKHEFYFENDIVASQPEKFFAAEIIRAHILKLYRDEIPFSSYIEIDDFKERSRGKDYIRAGIILEKESQKPIIIGSKGKKIKLLGERARRDIEEFLGHEVFLELFVKIRKNWKNDEEFLRKNFKKTAIPVT